MITCVSFCGYMKEIFFNNVLEFEFMIVLLIMINLWWCQLIVDYEPGECWWKDILLIRICSKMQNKMWGDFFYFEHIKYCIAPLKICVEINLTWFFLEKNKINHFKYLKMWWHFRCVINDLKLNVFLSWFLVNILFGIFKNVEKWNLWNFV